MGKWRLDSDADARAVRAAAARGNPADLERLEEFMGRAFRRFVEPLELRMLRSATVELTNPGHNLHVTVGQTVNIDPSSPLDIDYVKPLSVKWDLNYDG